MTIVLLGYMGCGKTFLGEKLSRILNRNYVDLDAYVEKQESMSIADIFKEKGELYFRRKEKSYLDLLLQNSQNQIIGLGGGTPCYFDTMTLLSAYPSVTTVYLKASISVLSSRLFKEKSHRPIISHLNSIGALQEFIGKHLFERLPYYNRADIVVDADKSYHTIITAIIAQLF